MHEMSIAEALIKIIEKEAKAIKIIKKINVNVGILKAVVPEALETAFDILRKGKRYESAKLIINVMPLKVVCGNCGKMHLYKNTHEAELTCGKCGSSNLEIKSGQELLIESIEGA